ncbi:MAG: right-handed parallel beta-helix repeat-containing protein [Blastocatellia bacterium]|nr:right-handed parallel beta-helix repeat-containing protein [Blastocatellia bacterium]
MVRGRLSGGVWVWALCLLCLGQIGRGLVSGQSFGFNRNGSHPARNFSQPNQSSVATFTVTNSNDAGTGSLRQAMLDANAASETRVLITILPLSQPINLLSSLPAINKPIFQLYGSTSSQAQVKRASGAANFRIFTVNAGLTACDFRFLTIAGGSAPGSGGAIESASRLILQDCLLNGNAAADSGGAISLTGGSATLQNCTFSNNTAASFGGALRVTGGASLTMTDCTVTGNSATNGGGISVAGSTLSLLQSCVGTNTASVWGGGVYVDSSVTTVTNCTISGNQAQGNSFFGGYGGGILNLNSTSCTISHCTIVNNTLSTTGATPKGGAVATITSSAGPNATTTLTNTILGSNSLPNLGTLNVLGQGNTPVVTSTGNNLSADDGSGLLNQPGDLLNSNPKLGSLSSISGSTQFYPLLSGSPAIDAGNSQVSGLPTSDQRGYSRPPGNAPDIGSCEVRHLVVTSANDNGSGTLRATLTEANTTVEPETILFSLPTGQQTITILSALPAITGEVTLSGPGADKLTVQPGAGANCRIFSIATGLSNVTIAGLSISGGNISGAFGGGVEANSPLQLLNCTLSNNQSGGSNGGGGGLYLAAQGIVSGCTFVNNSASVGGGIYFNGSSGVTLTVSNCTLTGNTATGGGFLGALGGGILNASFASGPATLSLTNCTLVNNSAPGGKGGALLTGAFNLNNNAGSTLQNNILAGNSPTTLELLGLNGNQPSIQSAGGNLSDGTGNGFLTASGDQTNTNPGLSNSGQFGSPTPVYGLLPGSAAINAGLSTGAPTTDQRGFGRVGNVDCGAFESQGFTVTITGGNNQSTVPGSAFPQPLNVTVSASNNEPVEGGRLFFTFPVSGASASIAVNPVTIPANGQVSSGTVIANSSAGTYQVSAAATGVLSPAVLTLSNSPLILNVQPSGGSLVAGFATSVTWTNAGYSGNVNLALSTDSGATFPLMIATDLTNAGSYSWNVPNLATSQARIRVQDAATGTPTGISAADFTIGSISNVQPSGDTFSAGAGTVISWVNPTGFSGNVDLLLSTDGGATFPTLIAGNLANSGSYGWTIPLVQTNQGKIRVQSSTNPVLQAESANSFGIVFFTNVQPSGTLLPVPGSTTISWTSPNGFGGNVDLLFSADGGATFPQTIAQNLTNTGSYVWTLPLAPTTQGRVLVQVAGDASRNGVSAQNLTLQASGPVITNVQPTAGRLQAGSQTTIRWTNNFGFAAAVTLEFSANGGTSWSPIVTNLANPTAQGSYTWTVPNVSSATCRVRVRETVLGTPSGQSATSFAINTTTATITNVEPSFGIFAVGSTTAITWLNANGFANPVNLALIADDSSFTPVTIATNVPNSGANGTYLWTVPNLSTTRARIRVSDATFPPRNTTSSASFTIQPLCSGGTVTLSGTTALPPGATLNLNATVTGGSGNYQFSWRKQDSARVLSTSASLTIATVTQTDSGTYAVTVNDLDNGCSLFGQTTVALQVNEGPGSFSYTVTGTTYPGAQPVNPPPAPAVDTSTYTTFGISGTLQNNSGLVYQSLFFEITQLNVTNPDPQRPYWVDNRSSGTGGTGSRVTVAGVPLAGNGSTPVTFNVAVDATNRRTFSLVANLYGATGTSSVQQKLGSFLIEGQPVRKSAPSAKPEINLGTVTELTSGETPFVTGAGIQANPVIAVDRKENRRMAVSCTNFATGQISVKCTEDGQTWREMLLPGTVGGITYQQAFDPALAYDGNGNLTVAYCLANAEDNACAVVSATKLLDRLSFNPPTILTAVAPGDRVFVKRTTLDSVGSRNVVVWEERTPTGGRIRLADSQSKFPLTLAQGALSQPTLTLGPEGRTYVGWLETSTGNLFCATSQDGLTFGAPILLAKTGMGAGRTIPALADVPVLAGLQLKADPLQPGTVYAVLVDAGASLDVWLTRSTTAGASWETRRNVNDDTAEGDQFNPALAVAPDRKEIAVSFSDTRLDGTRQTVNQFLARSTNGGVSFLPNERLSAVASNTSHQNPTRTACVNLGERTGMAPGGKGSYVCVWTDNRNGTEDVFLGRSFPQ